MKTVIRKVYANYEKEEKWLNDMSAKGFALIDYSWCRYVFSECLPGEYIYRIELLPNLAGHPESKKYVSFMEENNVEHIASYMRWVYFRKKAADGAFDIYSDIESKIKHYRSVNLLWSVLACAELSIGISNLLLGITSSQITNLIAGCILAFIGISFFALGHPLRKKMKILRREKNIWE